MVIEFCSYCNQGYSKPTEEVVLEGEERDIIIFSTGYAKDLASPEEKIGIQFGSLNRRDGEKYLNVAITRARREIIIVCSLDPDKIKVEDAKHSGPKNSLRFDMPLYFYIDQLLCPSEVNHTIQKLRRIFFSLSLIY